MGSNPTRAAKNVNNTMKNYGRICSKGKEISIAYLKNYTNGKVFISYDGQPILYLMVPQDSNNRTKFLAYDAGYFENNISWIIIVPISDFEIDNLATNKLTIFNALKQNSPTVLAKIDYNNVKNKVRLWEVDFNDFSVNDLPSYGVMLY